METNIDGFNVPAAQINALRDFDAAQINALRDFDAATHNWPGHCI